MANRSTYEVLGDRAPIPCEVGDAHGVAMAMMEAGTTVTALPFRHPPLLDNEIRIRVTHSGLCQSDVSFATNHWSPFGVFPMVPGHEIVGVV